VQSRLGNYNLAFQTGAGAGVAGARMTSSTGDTSGRILPRPAATPQDGKTFEDIVRYVSRRLRMAGAKVSLQVRQVLVSGIAFSRIERTKYGRYRLLQPKPPGLVCRIKDTRMSEDEGSSDYTSESE
jgi:hypothetical protein